jgi:serine/threonine-protein kinase RsbW
MRVEGGATQARSRRGVAAALHRIIDSNADAVSAALQDMFACDLLARLSEDSRGTVEIVLAEVLNNVVEHAYAQYPGTVELWVTPRDGYLFIRLIDQGLPMPEGEAPGGALSPVAEIQDMPEGGFGWFLIRTLTQDLIYARDGSQNVLSFCVGVDYMV